MKLRRLNYLCIFGIAAFVLLNIIILVSLHLPSKYGNRLWSKVVDDGIDHDGHWVDKDIVDWEHQHVITEEDFFKAWDDYEKENGLATTFNNSKQDVKRNTLKMSSPKKRKNKRNFVDLSCTMDTCFNFSRCLQEFKIYVYPKEGADSDFGGSTNSKDISTTYSKILEALRSSKYVTNDPDKACIFIPSVDTVDRDPLSANFQKDVESRLKRLPYWREHGSNHILFNLYAGSWPDYAEDQFDFTVDKAILVKASYSQRHFRHNYDISFPLIHAEHDLWPKPAQGLQNFLTTIRKRYLLTFKGKRYLTGRGSYSRNALFHLHNGQDVVMLTTCRHRSDWKRKQDARCPIDNDLYTKYDYRDLMYNSTLCLVPRGRRVGSYRFLEALEAGCVPVLLSNDYVLPFSEVIDWRAAVVWADERTLFQITDLVRNLGDAKIVAMRQQAKLLWDLYFSSVKSTVDTVLEIIRDRLEVRKRSIRTWNSPPSGGLLDQSSYSADECETPFIGSQSKCANLLDRGVGVSIMVTSTTTTSCSSASLLSTIKEMTRSKRVKKVLVLWACAKDVLSSSFFSAYVKPKNLLVLKLTGQRAKSPSSRFLWTSDIISFFRPVSAIFSLYSHEVELERGGISSEHIDFAYNVWHEFPERLVGFRSRGHYWDEAESVWRYSSRLVDSYSMITGPMLYHKYYSYLYFKHLSVKSRKLVDLFQCCEDFLMNFLIAHVTKRPPVRLLDHGLGDHASKEKPIAPSKIQDKMVCFHALTRDFTYMPLRRSYARWDPLLYKDEVATWRKKYARLEQ